MYVCSGGLPPQVTIDNPFTRLGFQAEGAFYVKQDLKNHKNKDIDRVWVFSSGPHPHFEIKADSGEFYLFWFIKRLFSSRENIFVRLSLLFTVGGGQFR